jgi:hypothetical protein
MISRGFFGKMVDPGARYLPRHRRGGKKESGVMNIFDASSSLQNRHVAY